MIRPPPLSPRTDPLVPYTTLFRSDAPHPHRILRGDRGDRGHRVTAEHRYRPDIGLNPRAPAAVGPGDDEHLRGHGNDLSPPRFGTVSPGPPDAAVLSMPGISPASLPRAVAGRAGSRRHSGSLRRDRYGDVEGKRSSVVDKVGGARS